MLANAWHLLRTSWLDVFRDLDVFVTVEFLDGFARREFFSGEINSVVGFDCRSIYTMVALLNEVTATLLSCTRLKQLQSAGEDRCNGG